MWRFAAITGLALTLCAEQLPVRVYTTDDGLPNDQVTKILRDSRGYLWFGTRQGLACFDGLAFKTFGPADGIPAGFVSDLAETRGGNLWVGTISGLWRLHAGDRSKAHKADAIRLDKNREMGVSALAVDREGILWVASNTNLFRLEADADSPKPERVSLGTAPLSLYGLFVDHLGTLWISNNRGVIERRPDGHIEEYTAQDGLVATAVVVEDRAGRIWAGGEDGVFRLSPGASGGRRKVELMYRRAGQPQTPVEAMWADSRGNILASLDPNIGEFSPDARPGAPPRFPYTYKNGLVDTYHPAITEDAAGNLWLGSENRGAIRIARAGFVSYDRSDGLDDTRIASLIQDRAGELLAIDRGPAPLDRWDGTRFTPLKINLPIGAQLGWGWNQMMLQDRSGDWWICTQRGLLRFPPVRANQLGSAQPKAFYTMRDGFSGNDIFHVYEDRRGDIWIATVGAANGLSRWDRASNRFVHYSTADGLPLDQTTAAGFAEDRQGHVWMAAVGWVARYHDGKFDVVVPPPSLRQTSVRDVYVDRRDRVWIATRGALLRIDDPSAPHIQMRSFTSADGLSDSSAFFVTEDAAGRIYVGTGRGVDRLDPDRFPGPASVRYFSRGDGLAPGQMNVARLDRSGTLWFGTLSGLSSFVPEPDVPHAPPEVWITGFRIRNSPQPLADLGQARVGPMELEPGQNQVQIDFSALSFWPGESPRFQYKMDGIDADWSAPTAQRNLNYTNLGAGRYHLQIRAIAAGSSVSPRPAQVEFTVLPPMWRRWWFLTACALAVTALAFALHRYLLAQALAVERMRTHIARDLHDEIGSSLSQIAILSEVAQHQQTSTTVPVIASIARELVDAMNDIVWAINPKHDRVENLLHRMRRFAEETLGACNIELRFHASEAASSKHTGPEIRRHIYLVFKEAVTNVAKHSGASVADVDLHVDGGWFRMSVADDGCGFDPARETDGDGLINMRKRVEALGGEFQLDSAPGQGVRLEVAIALVPRPGLVTRQN